MRTLRLSDEAKTEIREIIDHLDEESEKLSRRFVSEYEFAANSLLEYPRLYQRSDAVKNAECRRAKMRTMPYFLVYSIETEDDLVVVSVHHTSRDPTLWHDRVSK